MSFCLKAHHNWLFIKREPPDFSMIMKKNHGQEKYLKHFYPSNPEQNGTVVPHLTLCSQASWDHGLSKSTVELDCQHC